MLSELQFLSIIFLALLFASLVLFRSIVIQVREGDHFWAISTSVLLFFTVYVAIRVLLLLLSHM